MSTDLTALKSVAVVATRLGLSLYDKPSPAQDITLFAQTLNRATRQKTLHFEWWDAFPLIRKWVGDRQTFKGYKSGIDVVVESYELTFKLDLRELDLDGDRSLIQSAQDIGTQFAAGFTNGRFIFAYSPIRNNSTTTYDDQNLFDIDHVHPDGETFSNVIDISADARIPDRATSGFPTALEAKAELEAAVETLAQNRLRNVSIVELGTPPLVVITKSFGVWKGYHDLLTQNVISNTANIWFGGFRLLRDFDPVSGDENKVDVILAEPNGPRPVIFVPARNPGPLVLDDKWIFDRKEATYGSDADYGFAAALPHPVVRIQE